MPPKNTLITTPRCGSYALKKLSATMNPILPLKVDNYLLMSSMVYTSPTTPIPISTKIVARVVASDFITDQTVGICTCATR